jgi:hypothetical protein
MWHYIGVGVMMKKGGVLEYFIDMSHEAVPSVSLSSGYRAACSTYARRFNFLTRIEGDGINQAVENCSSVYGHISTTLA